MVVDTANSKKYTSDGFFNLSDYYPITVNGTGILQVNIRDQINVKQVVVLDASGEFVSFAKASKLSHRNNSTTQQRITSSGSYYMYIELEGRSSAEYRIGVDVYNQ